MTYLSLNITPSIQAPNNTIQERSVTETEGRLLSKKSHRQNSTTFHLGMK